RKPGASAGATGIGAEGHELAAALARAAGDLKAEAVKILDVRGLTDVTDFMVLATGTGERHLRAISDALEAAVREESRKRLGTEGSEGSGWIVVDVGDVVAHLFSGDRRVYYDLDGLWGDAKVLRFEADSRRTKEGTVE
ncbi:MAG: ribosome silencing factor, partial [Planctomycetota bacterium]